MHRYLRRGLRAALFAGGLWFAGTQFAHAATVRSDSAGPASTPPSSAALALTGFSAIQLIGFGVALLLGGLLLVVGIRGRRDRP